MNSKVAIITGVSGQDGSYMAEFLIEKGYMVYGIVRSGEHLNGGLKNLQKILDKINLVEGNLLDKKFIESLLMECKPDEVYNFAGISSVFKPYENFSLIFELNALTPIYFLESIINFSNKTKFFQASSAEMFDRSASGPKSEVSDFSPVNPYGHAKLLVHNVINDLRNKKKVFAISGIFFNHESPRRGENFLPRKISIEVSKLKLGMLSEILVGNLDAKRDWGYAPYFMEKSWELMQLEESDNYVFSTGKLHTVRELVEKSLSVLDIKVLWEGSGLDEVGKDKDGNIIIKVSDEFYREENKDFYGDNTKLKNSVNWDLEIDFDKMIEIMVNSDYNELK